MRSRFLSALLLPTLLLVIAPGVRAQDGFRGALEKINRTAPLAHPFATLSVPTLAIADLDGDDKPDGAILLESEGSHGQGYFEVELHFTGHRNANLKFQSLEPAVTVKALDINHDGDVDLIIEQSWTHRRLQVWINDGHGNFEKGRMEDFPSGLAPVRDRIGSSDRIDLQAFSLSSQRGFETMLVASHIAGRPPSDSDFAISSISLFRPDHALSLARSRAPPLS